MGTITFVVPEGANVKQGDTLVTLDSSNIKHKVDDLKVSLENAQANLVTAQQMEEIQKSQNAANLDAAQVALDLAKLDLEAYEKGTYPQALAAVRFTLLVAFVCVPLNMVFGLAAAWAIAIADDGQIVVDKSKKFQKELGQWSDPESFIKA